MPELQMPVADELAIRNLVARYAILADAGSLPEWADLYAEGGCWARENSAPAALGGSGFPPETVSGRDALMRHLERTVVERYGRRIRHQLTDLLVEPCDGPDAAKGICRALITDWRDGPGKIAMFGRYTWEFVRTPAGWRFSRVSVSVLPA